MDVFTIICIVITAFCLTWSLGVGVFALIKRAVLRNKAKKEVLLNDNDEEKQ